MAQPWRPRGPHRHVDDNHLRLIHCSTSSVRLQVSSADIGHAEALPDVLVEYQDGYDQVVVARDGDGLIFWSDFDDNGRSLRSESRMPLADFLAKGFGPWPWYDLGGRRTGALDALLVWWSVNARWFGYRASVVVGVVEILRAGGADVTEHHLELAAAAGVEAVQRALTRG